MAKRSARPPEPEVANPTAAFWLEIRQQLGRNLFFIDSGAILGSLEENDQQFAEFFETLDGTLVTSSYVVMETARRIAKDKHDAFKGPAGQRRVELALFVLTTWLQDYAVSVLHIPESIYREAIDLYEQNRHLDCDLNDILSVQIVRGLEQTRIVASDRRHFHQLGLDCLPSGPR